MGKKEKILLAVSYAVNTGVIILSENYYSTLITLIGSLAGIILYYLFFFKFLKGKVSVTGRVFLFILACVASWALMFGSIIVGAIMVGVVFSGIVRSGDEMGFAEKKSPELREQVDEAHNPVPYDKPVIDKAWRKSFGKYFLVLLFHPFLALLAWIGGNYVESARFSDLAKTGIYNIANLFSSPDFTNIFLVGIVAILPIVMSLRTFGWGKGLFFGAIISLTYTGIDFIFLKQISRCFDWCGVENAFVAIGIAIYGGVGLLIMIINDIRSTRHKVREVAVDPKLNK